MKGSAKGWASSLGLLACSDHGCEFTQLRAHLLADPCTCILAFTNILLIIKTIHSKLVHFIILINNRFRVAIDPQPHPLLHIPKPLATRKMRTRRNIRARAYALPSVAEASEVYKLGRVAVAGNTRIGVLRLCSEQIKPTPPIHHIMKVRRRSPISTLQTSL